MARIDVKILCILICIVVLVQYLDAEQYSRRRTSYSSRRRTTYTSRRRTTYSSRRRRSSYGGSSGSSSSSSASVGQIVGIVIGVIAIFVIGCLLYCFRREIARSCCGEPPQQTTNGRVIALQENPRYVGPVTNGNATSHATEPQAGPVFKGGMLVGQPGGAPPPYTAVAGGQGSVPPPYAENGAAAYPPTAGLPYPPQESSSELPYPPQQTNADPPYPPQVSASPPYPPLQPSANPQEQSSADPLYPPSEGAQLPQDDTGIPQPRFEASAPPLQVNMDTADLAPPPSYEETQKSKVD